jgi:hypothetical protein
MPGPIGAARRSRHALGICSPGLPQNLVGHAHSNSTTAWRPLLERLCAHHRAANCLSTSSLARASSSVSDRGLHVDRSTSAKSVCAAATRVVALASRGEKGMSKVKPQNPAVSTCSSGPSSFPLWRLSRIASQMD